MPGDALAELVVDPGRVIDIDAEPFSTGKLDSEHLDVGLARSKPSLDLTLKLSFSLEDLRHHAPLDRVRPPHEKRAQSAHFQLQRPCGGELKNSKADAPRTGRL